MPPVRVCLFCEASGKLTSAHLISQSLQRLLPASSDGTDRMEWWVDESELTEKTNRQFINVHAANHQVRRLCHSCNGNWMAAFEDATRALLLDLYHGRPVSWTPRSKPISLRGLRSSACCALPRTEARRCWQMQMRRPSGCTMRPRRDTRFGWCTVRTQRRSACATTEAQSVIARGGSAGYGWGHPYWS
jgi:hypothetical protein